MRTQLFTGLLLMVLVLAAGCSKATLQAAPCTTKECFVAAANDCKDMTITATEDTGTFQYASSNCVFTKTLVSTNGSQDVKNLLEGKSFTCTYTKGNFDQRWTSSLVLGLENCTGALKDNLLMLTAFT